MIILRRAGILRCDFAQFGIVAGLMGDLNGKKEPLKKSIEIGYNLYKIDLQIPSLILKECVEMKKPIFTFVILLILLSMTATSALAASGNLVLRVVRNDPGGGVIFIFEYTGDFTDGDFKGGSVLFNGHYYPLDCNIAEGTGEVWCTASSALVGQYVQVFLAGFIFWDRVPEGGRGFGGGGGICYNVYDYYFTEGRGFFAQWDDIGDNCQDTAANYGDDINGFSPFHGGFPGYYEFMPEEPCGQGWNPDDLVEDAYYYPICSD